MGMTAAATALRLEVEEAVFAEVAKAGPEFRRSSVVNQFLDRGAGKSTLFRWVNEVIDSGRPGQHVARIVQAAAAERAARAVDPAADVAIAIAAKLPIRVTAEDMTGVVRLVEKLRAIVRDIDLLIAHSKADDGKVRNARLLLAANGEMRKTLETALRMQEAMHSAQQIDKMHDAILDEVAKLAPETAEAILRRIDLVAAQWEV
jgi:hypothetical protein